MLYLSSLTYVFADKIINVHGQDVRVCLAGLNGLHSSAEIHEHLIDARCDPNISGL